MKNGDPHEMGEKKRYNISITISTRTNFRLNITEAKYFMQKEYYEENNSTCMPCLRICHILQRLKHVEYYHRRQSLKLLEASGGHSLRPCLVFSLDFYYRDAMLPQQPLLCIYSKWVLVLLLGARI